MHACHVILVCMLVFLLLYIGSIPQLKPWDYPMFGVTVLCATIFPHLYKLSYIVTYKCRNTICLTLVGNGQCTIKQRLFVCCTFICFLCSNLLLLVVISFLLPCWLYKNWDSVRPSGCGKTVTLHFYQKLNIMAPQNALIVHN